MKHEFPPFNMVIENGRLVPATPYDAERLDSFTRGTRVKVRFTEEKDRVLVRKWFAIIGLVVKQCQTPWKNKDQAHEAIKLALGIVNLSKTVNGEYMAYPKSLADLEDPELKDALDQMTELLSRMTGVDVDTLNKETAHIQSEPDDEPHDEETGELFPNNEASDDAAPGASDVGGAPLAPSEPAGETISGPAGSAPGKFSFEGDDLKWIAEYAEKGSRESRRSDEPIALKFLEDMYPNYVKELVSADAVTALNSIKRGLELAVTGARDIDRIEEWIATEFLNDNVTVLEGRK